MFDSPNVRPGERLEGEERWEAVHLGHRILSIGLLLVGLALAGGGWYAYKALQRHEGALAQFAGVQKVMEAIGDQVRQTDQKLASWAYDQQSTRSDGQTGPEDGDEGCERHQAGAGVFR